MDQEVDLNIALPKTQKAFARHSDELLTRTLASVRERSDTLYDFIGLGAMSVQQGASAHLVTDKQLWQRTYPGGCDRMSISPDGGVIYLPSLLLLLMFSPLIS